jgi:hypothetical protein
VRPEDRPALTGISANLRQTCLLAVNPSFGGSAGPDLTFQLPKRGFRESGVHLSGKGVHGQSFRGGGPLAINKNFVTRRDLLSQTPSVRCMLYEAKPVRQKSFLDPS